MTLAAQGHPAPGHPGADRARRRRRAELRGEAARNLDRLLDSLHQDLRALLGMKPETRSRIVFSVQPPDAKPRRRRRIRRPPPSGRRITPSHCQGHTRDDARGRRGTAREPRHHPPERQPAAEASRRFDADRRWARRGCWVVWCLSTARPAGRTIHGFHATGFEAPRRLVFGAWFRDGDACDWRSACGPS
jgi:hypothetical protein